ncbi:hypothetical protein SKAU_G00239660 [Synaphobranchus kaupii]|uniref:Uncharacterized protein n=1 Tax=Synaphobranchus kaupii TaxID=118154 RepID=A0A9Q1F7E7_SYNKA|nr:hypothetical protein SKAU_G00239660 [Synaphobranchus kaupii]
MASRPLGGPALHGRALTGARWPLPAPPPPLLEWDSDTIWFISKCRVWRARTCGRWTDWVIDPSSEFYFTWLQVMVFPVLYNWVIIICRTCFDAIEENYLAVWLTIDYISDLFYVADTVIRSRTGYLDQGILVHDLNLLKKHYMRSTRFRWDLASLLPTDLLYLQLGIHFPLVRVNRFLRTTRLSEAFDRMETRTSYPNTFRISKLMLYIFVLIHWNACLYFSLSKYIGFGADRWVYPNISNPVFASVRRQYFYCFWFSAQIFTTVGDTPLPNREEEYLFMIADLLIAVLAFASIVGNVGNVITNLRDRDKFFFPNHELVKGYLRSHRINKELHGRVNSWYQHLHINKKITRENEILLELPGTLRTEIAVSVHLPTLSKVTIFQNCETSLLEELVLKLTPQGREPSSVRSAFSTSKGTNQATGARQNIRSIGHADLFSLSKEDLMNVLSEFPAAKRLLEEKGRQILTKMGKLDETDTADGPEEEGKMMRKVDQIEDNLNAMHTKLARLMAELESSDRKIKRRVELLEKEAELLKSQEDWGEGGKADAGGTARRGGAEERRAGGKGEGTSEQSGNRGEGAGRSGRRKRGCKEQERMRRETEARWRDNYE